MYKNNYKNIKSKSKSKNKSKIVKLIFFIFLLIILWNIFLKPFNLNNSIIIKKGDTFQNFVTELSSLEKLGLKIYLSFNKDGIDLSKIQEGTYNFAGKYSKSEFLDVIAQGPKQSFKKYTVLEGWSIYDIDLDLSNKGLIEKGDYISFVTDPTILGKYKDRYDFLNEKMHIAKELTTLEGFLYPDTYHLDVEGNLADQLIYLQLENFNKKVWVVYSGQISDFTKFSFYDLLILSTVVEKEERSNANKSTVAGIFFNRLDKGMRLDADITLCYGLKEPYETCTPSVIVKKISDKSNIYNTRQNYGLPPQPIANPSVESIAAVLNFKKTDYLYYLHDASGNIHYGKTLEEHNSNKNNYLN